MILTVELPHGILCVAEVLVVDEGKSRGIACNPDLRELHGRHVRARPENNEHMSRSSNSISAHLVELSETAKLILDLTLVDIGRQASHVNCGGSRPL